MRSTTAATTIAPSPTSSQAIKLDPNDVTAFNDRGIAYGAKGDHDRAIKDFDQVVKADAKTPWL